jgi:hypothetical protein
MILWQDLNDLLSQRWLWRTLTTNNRWRELLSLPQIFARAEPIEQVFAKNQTLGTAKPPHERSGRLCTCELLGDFTKDDWAN